MTRIRQVAPLLRIINFNNLCFRVENETTLISAKNRVDLSSISEVRSYITEWPRFLGHHVYLAKPASYYAYYGPTSSNSPYRRRFTCHESRANRQACRGCGYPWILCCRIC